MKERDRRDPTSWIYQANIHGTTETDDLPGWNTCQHGSFLFLPWHRMQLYWFERLLRAASGDPDLTVPYWDYTNTAQTALPIAFREPADASNPLYVNERNPLINLGYRLSPPIVNFAAPFHFRNFSSRTGSAMSFGGSRESIHYGRPHGQMEAQHDCLHVILGLTRTGFMQNPNSSARDPIFWVHHATTDRLWKRWLDMGGQNPGFRPGEERWYKTQFLFFDENGREVRMTAADVLDTVRQLHYCYDDDPPPLPTIIFASEPRLLAASMQAQAAQAEAPTVLGASTTGVVLGAHPAEVRVPLTAPVALPVAAAPMQAQGLVQIGGEHAGQIRRLLLHLESVDFEEYPSNVYEVYLNLPEGEEPSFRSRYYVGAVAFFAQRPMRAALAEHGGGHGAHGEDGGGGQAQSQVFRSFDITPNVVALREHGEWDEKTVRVRFYPTQLLEPMKTEQRSALASFRGGAAQARSLQQRVLDAASEPITIGAVRLTAEAPELDDVFELPAGGAPLVAPAAAAPAKAPAPARAQARQAAAPAKAPAQARAQARQAAAPKRTAGSTPAAPTRRKQGSGRAPSIRK
ncbi:tyrosinase family protein [Sorangium sp. So ce321]|uniref:tyrosinase family protein n=1 Tax=Sorangium sp. So ce321 TaxID=3133300 RepID=UPI003F6171FD